MIRLNYKTYGEGSPVLIFHGIFGMLDNWNSFGKKLAETHKVYLIDQRDHGRSPHTDEFSYPILAQDIFDFLVEHNLEKVHLIGHSMGGKAVMEFALSHPDKVVKMVVVDMGIKAYEGGHEYIIDALSNVPIDEVTSRRMVEEHLSQEINSFSVRQFLMKNLTRNPEGGYTWKINLSLLKESYADLMAHDLSQRERVEVDTLFINGLKSDYILSEDESKILEVFPLASFLGLEAGHWVHAEKPEELLKQVQLFFEG